MRCVVEYKETIHFYIVYFFHIFLHYIYCIAEQFSTYIASNQHKKTYAFSMAC